MKVGLTLWKEQAKEVAEALNLVMVGDTADINVKVTFTKESAGGYDKVRVGFDL